MIRRRVLWVLPAMGMLAACGSGAASNPTPRSSPTTRPVAAPTTSTTTSPPPTAAPVAQHPPAVDSTPWTASRLTITPQSLGAVRVGMTLTQAQSAAGVTFDGFGDGFAYPTTLPAGFPHDFVGGTGNNPAGVVTCVGSSGLPTGQSVATPQGLHLGDPESQVVAVYGAQARPVPAPTTGGMTDYSGYVVSTPTGNFAFVVTNRRVSEIEGGDSSLGPNSCTG